MNQQHFDAIIRGSGNRLVIEVGGRRLASNGMVAGFSEEFPATTAPKDVNRLRDFRERWAKWSEEDYPVVSVPSEVVEVGGDNKSFARILSDRFGIQEAFYQTFADPAVTWHWDGTDKHPVVVRQDGALIGAMAAYRIGKSIAAGPTLEEVFCRFANEDNGYYLRSEGSVIAGLIAEIEALESERDETEEKISDLEDQRDGIDNELTEKRKALADRIKKAA